MTNTVGFGRKIYREFARFAALIRERRRINMIYDSNEQRSQVEIFIINGLKSSASCW